MSEMLTTSHEQKMINQIDRSRVITTATAKITAGILGGCSGGVSDPKLEKDPPRKP